MKNNHTFSFGPFALDNTDKELRCGEVVIHLFPQQFDLLLYLVQNNNQLLKKKDLLSKFWEEKGKYVEDGNLTRVISELRSKLSPHGKKYIRGVSTYGYRFEVEVIEKQPEIPPDKCPWVGLPALDVPQARYFHGRDKEVCEVLDLLRASNFLAVVGSSGSGKSSLVRAGLIPALQNGALGDGPEWKVLLFRPSSSPLKKLAEQLLKTEGRPANVEATEALADKLRTSPDALSENLFPQRGDDGNRRVVIAVDQFEELITHGSDLKECQSFIECLMASISVPGQRPLVVITFRTDFYSAFEGYEKLWEQITRRQYGVRHLSREQLRQVIKNPAAIVGLEVEEALVEEILSDLGASQGSLPLLSHAMAELFKRREGKRLTYDAYISLGRVRETIANHANAVFEKFSPDEQAMARLILLKLIKVGEEPENDVRRQVPMSELASNPKQLPAVESVVRKLSQERLLTTWSPNEVRSNSAEPTPPVILVELAHESLIRHWQRLSAWLKDKHRARRLFVGIDISARTWSESNRDPDSLYRGNRLANTLDARAEYEEFLGRLHREFLEASVKLEEEQRREREREMRREEVRRKLRQRHKAVTVIAVVLALLVAIASWKWLEAGQQRSLAQANGWAGASISQLSSDPELSLLLATEAAQLGMTPETTKALRQALAASYAQATFPAHQMQVLSVAVSQDRRFLLTGGADEARLWNLAEKKLVRTLRGHADWITWAALSPDGNQAVTASRDHTARVWDLSNGSMITELRGHTDEVNHAIFSPDGTKILTAGQDNTARIWDAKTGQRLKVLTGHKSWINTTAYSPDGKLIATASGDGTARVWDAQTGQTIGTLAGHKGTVISVAFDPDVKEIITGSSDKTAKIWEVGTWKEKRQLLGHLLKVDSTEFSHNGKWILTASKDGTARLWNAKNGFPIMDFRGHFSGVNTAVFSPDDAHIYTAGGDQTARVWEVRLPTVVANLAGHKDAVSSAVFSPDGERIATASNDKTAMIWDAKTGTMLKLLPHSGPVLSAVFSPDGTQIATSSDKEARLWNVETGTMLKEFIGHADIVNTVAFSADGSRIVTASSDKTARVWEVSSGRRLMQFTGHKNGVNHASFSPDGKMIATASDDNIIRGWDAESGKVQFEWNVWNTVDEKAHSVRFSLDGKYLVASCGDQTVRVWSLDNREITAVLRSRDQGLNYAEFSQSGELVIAAGSDQTTHLWEFGSGRTLLQLPNAQGEAVTHASFSPDGRLIVTADKKGGVAVYECDLCGASHQELLALARKRKTRELTPAERARYLTSGLR